MQQQSTFMPLLACPTIDRTLVVFNVVVMHNEEGVLHWHENIGLINLSPTTPYTWKDDKFLRTFGKPIGLYYASMAQKEKYKIFSLGKSIDGSKKKNFKK